ncbi:hypothetical protein ikematsu_02640 [Limosilactobacillus fermentum]|nr:hypothetical protein ikematsu_02640 [Limosilactobacillus fermentum]
MGKKRPSVEYKHPIYKKLEFTFTTTEVEKENRSDLVMIPGALRWSLKTLAILKIVKRTLID